MVLRQKKDSILPRMKKITITETFLERLKRNSSWSILSRPDNVKKMYQYIAKEKYEKDGLAC